MRMPAAVRIVEVGPRDGLQNEKIDIEKHYAQDRAINRLSIRSAQYRGLPSSAPNGCHRWPMPVFMMAGSPAPPASVIPVLVPNRAGYARALAAGATEVAVFTAASKPSI